MSLVTCHLSLELVMKKAFIVGIIIILLGLILYGWWGSQLDPVSSDTSEQSFVITKGQGLNEIADNLKNKDLIRSTSSFKNYAKQNGLDAKVQPGTFKLSPSMSSQEIAIAITNQPLDNWVTLLEGWRVEEMAEKLNQQGLAQSAEFIKKAKEGYMFPDTYLIPKDYSVDQIVDLLRSTFEQKFTPELRKKIRAQGLTEEQGIILASIVEREARSSEVRRQVASILLKRFKIDMGLNADATIQYALGYQPEEKTWWKKRILYEDLEIESPFNTYIHVGLPPKPIANPSLSSIEAVADADAKTPYLYYFHDSKGNSYYGRTLEEHNENVANHR